MVCFESYLKDMGFGAVVWKIFFFVIQAKKSQKPFQVDVFLFYEKVEIFTWPIHPPKGFDIGSPAKKLFLKY